MDAGGTPATIPELVGAVHELLIESGPLTDEEIEQALVDGGYDLGADPDETMAILFDDMYIPLTVPVLDVRRAFLPTLLAGRTITYRVHPADLEHDVLAASPHLLPFTTVAEDDPERMRLVEGGDIHDVVPGIDDEGQLDERGIPDDERWDGGCWVLPPGTLAGLGVAAGDLIGIRIEVDGFVLAPVSASPLPDDVRSILVDQVERHDEPWDIPMVVWDACATDPAVFTVPLLPLVELFEECGLAVEGEQVAPGGFDFAAHRVETRVSYLRRVHQLSDDDALAVVGLAKLFDGIGELFEAAQAVRAGEEGAEADFVELLPREPDAQPTDDPGEVRRLVRDLLPSLAEPAAVEALLSETLGADADDAPVLGLFAEHLETQAPRSAQGGLRWLRAKAHERLGEVEEAESQLEAALALDPDNPLVLFDLARYAADRGDVERGLSLLRRAGARPDDPLLAVLEHFRPRARTDIGRNDPCWCGSGRKYKQCHLGRETVGLEDRAAWLYQKAGTYLQDGPWRWAALQIARAYARHLPGTGVFDALDEPLVSDVALFERGVFEAFVDERGVLLPDDERLTADQWLLAERSLHEVESVEPGASITVRDLRTGDRHVVRERTASRMARPGTLICARIVPAGDTMQIFGGVEVVPLGNRDAVLDLLDAGDEEELVAFLGGQHAPPTLTDTEGDPLVMCEAELEVHDPEALAAQLDNRYDLDAGGAPGEGPWVEHLERDGRQWVRGTLRLDCDRLHIETNSERRLERLLDVVRDLAPSARLVDERRRPIADLQEAMGRSGQAEAQLMTADEVSPEVEDLMADLIRQHEAGWLDESIPALGGVTPRAAAADPTRRPDLIRLLDSFPDDERPGVMSARRLRQALGL